MEAAGGVEAKLDPVENLEALVTAYQQEAVVQASSASALDQKLMGLLAFLVAAAGLLLTASNGLHHWRWILFVGAAGGIVLSLVGLVAGDDTKAGPDPKEFYEKWGGGTPREYIEQLTADLGRTVAKNKDHVELRRGLMTLSLTSAVLAGIVFGLARALAAILK
jgi:hypothetical protein